MGGSLGSPIDDATQDKINETIQDVIKIFSVEYSKSFTQAIISQAMAGDDAPDAYSQMKLKESEAASTPLKTGTLIKRGDSVKNWKERTFVAYNAADNYKIDYLDGTAETGKLKGTIYCAGYRAQEFNSDDVAEHGEAGIKIVPYSSRRRTWWIKCADESLRNEWMDVFQTACYKATAPRDEDECIAIAFDTTMKKLRWHFNFWGRSYNAGGEAEQLGEFLLELLDRDIIGEIISNLADNAMKTATTSLIIKTIGSLVKGAAGSAWISSATAVRSLSASIQSTVKETLAPIKNAQEKFKGLVLQKINKLVDPLLQTTGAAVLSPILLVIVRPGIEVFVQTATGFHAHISKKIAAGEFTDDKFKSSLAQSDYQMDWRSGPLHKSYVLIDRMFSQDMATVAQLFPTGVTPHAISLMLKDKVQLLAHRAVFTFGYLVQDEMEEPPVALAKASAMLFHDCHLLLGACLAETMASLLETPMAEMVIAPAGELIAPLQDQIDALPGLNMLLDLSALLEDTVLGVQTNAIDSLLKKSTSEIKQAFDLASAELGLAKIKL
ncbi:hypothetical protein B484DRAFT_392067 [Ochromonadaceae sp. CCMP2298]|nr:hypothetical protein B484DRAFT_392067 [Ochromonadaceae sp. CCMP2298]|mmetsp:Transcript_32657/g.71850  ORF Transcript_32657/g.71850 Transcript_32657/m.71850 type:complete len:552 (-) Transcript_32657:889-2544(-)|eukprot:CAMPEP_0173177730 /NCGR_PEP_ID=MMETSP1141-20130122/5147_1 /TAXON_ID=483371 /ORGANISM="non described non described, Strain CCMP2298" /LENGTH=551 /DNA_ID=CAMNT_0014100151 /DNA_START=124 /DNA_END=1779 /DNA_ORIENTATION=-